MPVIFVLILHGAPIRSLRLRRATIRPVVAEAEGRLLREDLPIQAASPANPFGEAAFGRG